MKTDTVGLLFAALANDTNPYRLARHCPAEIWLWAQGAPPEQVVEREMRTMLSAAEIQLGEGK